MEEGKHFPKVDVNHFNQEGAEALRRSVSRLSRADAETASMSSTDTLESSFDFRKVLESISQQRDDANIKSRELGIVFEDLRVVGVGATASHQPTLAAMFNPFANRHATKQAKTRDILSGFEGTVLPGEMLLVLGRPGSGCTTLLKTLANQRGEYHSFHGEVHYDSLSPAEVAKHHLGDTIFCPEDDVHFPTLTVEQTISFAAKLRAPHLRLGHSRDQYADAVTDLLTTIFGLKECRKTLVGDAAIRGVSGGQKKRVSIAEVLAARACIASWDNSTRGLDASTALEFVRALRIATDIAKMTTIVSLYQAGESLYRVFDKVCLIYDGKMAYYGPADQARAYFMEMGYEPANRQTTADFLVAVTDPNGRTTRPGALNVPRTAEEFAAYFEKSDIAALNKKHIAQFKADRVGKEDRVQAYKESAKAEYAKHTFKSAPRIVSLPMQTRIVMLRRLQILHGNFLATVLNLFSFAFQGVIIGSVYLKMATTTDTYFSRGGVLFFAIFFSALISMAEIPSLFAQRPIILRQSSWALYRPFVDQIALTIVDIPIGFATSAIFAILVYEMAQLQQSASQFFIFFLFMFTTSLTMKSWFRAVAAALPDEALAQTVAGISILAYSVYTGYSLPLPQMIGALKWISYINPLRWSFEAVMTNEFHTINGTCGNLVPQGPGYEGISLENQVCPVVGAQPGVSTVDGSDFARLSFNYLHSNTWRNFGILVAYGIGYTLAMIFFAEINNRMSASKSMVLFKQGSKSDIVTSKPDDIERASQQTAEGNEKAGGDYEKAMKDTPTVTDVFSWQRLSYTVPTDGGPRKLLNDVSGFVLPGKLTALMGESGAGKTTLLNVLAQRVDVGVVTGDRFVNGHGLPRDFQAQTGYCQQQDVHVPSQTVEEALLFSAQLRQPASVPDSEKKAYVDKCIKLCGLEPYRDAIVGSLSVENKKRTTIGVELAAKPKLLLFLDEPTSGLDSQSAWGIMLFLRDLADNGQAILCTIHQPSGELFQMFDRLLLLRKGGETVYFGDLGHNSSTLLDYFQRNGARECDDEENPAEYMLEVIGAGATATVKENWHDIWIKSREFGQVQQQIEDIHTTGRAQPPVAAELHTTYATGWFNQTIHLTKRDFSVHNRDPNYMMAKVMLNITSGLFLGFSFFLSDNTQAGVQGKLFSIFMALIISVPLANQLQIPFLSMRSIYEIREQPSKMYSWTALVTSQILVEVPWNIVGSSIFFFCWYWTSGFISDRAGYSYLMMGVLFPIYYTTIGQSVAAMSPNAEIAAILFSFLFSFVLTFNGVVQPYRELGWWQWMYRVSPYTYVIEGLLGQAVGEMEINCSDVEFVKINPPSGQTCSEYMGPYISMAGGYLSNPDASSDCGFCSTRTTDEWLGNLFNIYYSHHWRNIGLIIAFIGFNIASIYAFTWFFRIRKRSLLDIIRGKGKQ